MSGSEPERSELLKGTLDMLVLQTLSVQPLHGYGVMLAVRELSGQRLNLRPGTLYAALDRLTEEGLLVVDREDEHVAVEHFEPETRPREEVRLVDRDLHLRTVRTSAYCSA